MRCNKAKEYYFLSRDELLGEQERIKLQEHLSRCKECSTFVKEMDASLSLLSELDELSPSEGFEWNVKRRILQEKTKLMRAAENEQYRFGYFLKFIGASIAAAAIVLVSVYTIMNFDTDSGIKVANRVSPSSHHQTISFPSNRSSKGLALVSSSQPTQARYVSQTIGGYPLEYSSSRAFPLSTVSLSKDDSLLWENAILRKRVLDLEREVIYLRRLIKRMQKSSSR